MDNPLATEPGTDPSAPAQALNFPVVAVGASAGGLEALESFFRRMPADSGMAFVVVTHHGAGQPFLLPDLLRRHTAMEVRTAEEGMALRPGEIVLSPPGALLALEKGRLRLTAPSPPALPQSIDAFLLSLAREAKRCALAVILSGQGIDGTRGVKAVKEGGGIVIVQAPETAAYPSMPQSALLTGAVDFILPASEIPLRLLASRDFCRRKETLPSLQRRILDILPEIRELLLERTGNSLEGYKPMTLVRRVERRMHLRGCADVPDYLGILREEPREGAALFGDFLINVTGFFRDPDAFESLRRNLSGLPRHEEAPLRLWVPGCATGEEAYSLAMMLREQSGEEGWSAAVQVFATDIDPEAVARARAGLYPAPPQGLSPHRLERFFLRENGHYRVAEELRETVVFAQHNLLRDPPFSRLDLISCRNLFIYLDASTQSRLLALFHYALRPGGFLFLGSSESIGDCTDLFETVDSKWKIFRRRPAAVGASRELFLRGGHGTPAPRPAVARPEPETVPRKAERTLLRRYAPPSVIVNSRLQVVHAFGRTVPFLEPVVGEASLDVLKMARRELRPLLRAAIHRGFAEKRECLYQGVKIEEGGAERLFNLAVEPLEGLADHVLIVFEEASAAVREVTAPMTCDDLVRQLEEQLRGTTEQLHANIEEWERSDEALKASNEELMSMNEELQSANEELETSKEELQALNEELATVNAELQLRMEEIARANNDLQNLMNSSRVATVFLDKELRIQRFTPAAAELFNLIPSDVGRPIRHISGNLRYPHLERDVHRVLQHLRPIETEVPGPDDACFLARVLPYRTLKDVIEGTVLTFTDVSELKRTERALAESGRLAEARAAEAQEKQRLLDALMEYIPIGITIADAPDVNIRMVSRFGRDLVGRPPEEIEGIPADDHPSRWGIFHLDGARTAGEDLPLTRAVRKGETVRGEEFVLRRGDGGEIVISCDAGPIRDGRGKITGGLIAWQDVTRRKRAEEEARRQQEELAVKSSQLTAMFEHSTAGLVLFDAAPPYPVLAANRWYQELWPEPYRSRGLVGVPLSTYIPDLAEAGIARVFEEVVSCGKGKSIRNFHYAVGGRDRWWNWTLEPVFRDGRVVALAHLAVDVTAEVEARARVEETAEELARAHRSLQESNGRLHSLVEGTSDLIAALDTDFRFIFFNKAYKAEFEKIFGVALEQGTSLPEALSHLPTEKAVAMEVWERALRGEEFSVEKELGAPQRERRFYDIRFSSIRDEEGNLIGASHIVRDATDRRRAEKALREAKKAAEEATLAKSEFLSHMNHEIRTPLTVIIAGLEHLSHGSATADQRPLLDMAATAADRLLAIVNDTLDLSRIEARKVELTKEAFDLRECVSKTLRLFDMKAAEKGLTLSCRLSPDLPPIVSGYPDSLGQVLTNLVGNALKFTERGEVTVSVDPREGDRVLFGVRDTGIGIHSSKQRLIFESFGQVNGGKYGGSGLGLAISKGLVELMGGEIRVESEEGRGTLFAFVLPLPPAGAPEETGR